MHSKCYIQDERYSVRHGPETQAPWGHHHRKTGLEPSLQHYCKQSKQNSGCLRRHLKGCLKSVKSTAYKALIRPQLEYCSSVWDPYHQMDKATLERVQRRAARFVTGLQEGIQRYHHDQQLRVENLRRTKSSITIDLNVQNNQQAGRR